MLTLPLNFLIFPARDQARVFDRLGMSRIEERSAASAVSLLLFARTAVAQIRASVTGYLEGRPHPSASPWYAWPFMQIPIKLYTDPRFPEQAIVLAGNPVVWFGGTIASIFGLTALSRYLRAFRRDAGKRSELRPLFILLGGYVGALLPYAIVVHRSTFLYHYFPALLFSICLLAWFLARWLKLDAFENVRASQAAALGFIVFLSVLGFGMVAPLTYGL